MKLGYPSQTEAVAPPVGGMLLRALGICLSVALVVILIEGFILWVGFFDAGQAVWWPTNALVLALMLRADRRHWPAILVGGLLGSLTGQLRYHYPMDLNTSNMLANSSGPLIGALMLPRFRKLEDWLQEPQLVARFVFYVLIVAPIVSATLYASYAHLVLKGFSFWDLAHRRAVADMLGYALFTPLTLVLSSSNAYRVSGVRKTATSLFLVLMLLSTTAAVFSQSAYPVTFILASIMLIVVMRLRFRASVVIVNLMAAMVTTATMHGYGPLVLGGGSAIGPRIILLQLFLTLSMVTVFSISVIQLEREMFQSKLQLAYGEMEVLATIDALTGVANRRRFQDVLEQEWSRAARSGESVAVLILDVDHFKSYNDVHGHLAGDSCLRAIAQALLAREHRGSDLLARYGGEEFVLLLPATSLESASMIAEDLRTTVEGLFLKNAGPLQRMVTVSIGCAAMQPLVSAFATALIGCADDALYRAKRGGRNRVELGLAYEERLLQKPKTSDAPRHIGLAEDEAVPCS